MRDTLFLHIAVYTFRAILYILHDYRGSYGVVRRVIDKNSGNSYAAKFLRYSDAFIKDELASELEVLALLDHPNIVQVIDGYEDRKRMVIVEEMYPWQPGHVTTKST